MNNDIHNDSFAAKLKPTPQNRDLSRSQLDSTRGHDVAGGWRDEWRGLHPRR
jgi:hypothetical protein